MLLNDGNYLQNKGWFLTIYKFNCCCGAGGNMGLYARLVLNLNFSFKIFYFDSIQNHQCLTVSKVSFYLKLVSKIRVNIVSKDVNQELL